MQETQSPEDKNGHQDTNQESGPSPGKAPFLLFVYLGLSLVVIVLILLVYGPSQRMPDGRPAPAPQGATAPHSRDAAAPHTRDGLSPDSRNGRAPASSEGEPQTASQAFLYEEHLPGADARGDEGAGAYEARGAIAKVPSPEGAPGPAAETPEQGAETAAPGKAPSTAPSEYKSIPSDAAERPASPPAQNGPSAPALAIVIDDLGDSPAFAKALLDLDFPVTLAVMPYRTRSKKVAELAVSAGAEVILHQPMEPLAYPGTDPGEGALFTGMSPSKIKAVLRANLAQVPGADGMNNHMGSRFTRDAAGMAEVMRFLAENGMFFLDSVTSSGSAAEAAAHKAGTPMIGRNVFLDNSRNPNAIARQLNAAEETARSRGRAVAIGHPYKETLAALRWWASRRDPAVRMIFLRDLPGLTN